MKHLLRYLFPKRRLRDKTPLPPLAYSSEYSSDGPVPRQLRFKIAMLKGQGVARTDADAYRLLKKYPGQSVKQIVKQEKRPRRPMNRLRRALRRLRRLW